MDIEGEIELKIENGELKIESAKPSAVSLPVFNFQFSIFNFQFFFSFSPLRRIAMKEFLAQ